MILEYRILFQNKLIYLGIRLSLQQLASGGFLSRRDLKNRFLGNLVLSAQELFPFDLKHYKN